MHFLFFIFSFNLFSANINLFTQAQSQERAEVESLLNSFNDNLTIFYNYNLSKDDQDRLRLNELKQLINSMANTCNAFLEEAKQDHTMPKLLKHKEFTKNSLVMAARTIGLFLQKLSGDDNDNFSLQNLNQESKIINKIRAKLNNLQIAQKTILTLISPEEIDMEEEPITEVVIEANTDRDEEMAGLLNFELNFRNQIEEENQRIRNSIKEKQTNQKQNIFFEQKKDIDEIRLNFFEKSKKDIITTPPVPPFCNLNVSEICENIEKPEIFEKLPTEIWALIISNFSAQDQISFLKTCKFAKSLVDNHGNYLESKINNFHFIDNNWLIYFKDKEFYTTRPHKLSLFYRLDSNSCFNLIKTFDISLNLDKSFKKFLRKNNDNEIYLLFTGDYSEYSICILENLFTDKNLLVKSIISTDRYTRKDLTSELKNNNFYHIYLNYPLNGKEKIYLENYSKYIETMKHNIKKLHKNITEIEKFLDYKSQPVIDAFKNSITKEQYNRIADKISDDKLLYLLKLRIIDEAALIKYLFDFKKSQNTVNEKITEHNEIHTKINTYKEEINIIKNSVFLYSFFNDSSIDYIVHHISDIKDKKEYTYIDENIKIIQKTDEELINQTSCCIM
jgi:hypothetical protein